jgi:hypothetical protein
MIIECVLNDNDHHDEKFNSTTSIKKSYNEHYCLLEKNGKSKDLNLKENYTLHQKFVRYKTCFLNKNEFIHNSNYNFLRNVSCDPIATDQRNEM